MESHDPESANGLPGGPRRVHFGSINTVPFETDAGDGDGDAQSDCHDDDQDGLGEDAHAPYQPPDACEGRLDLLDALRGLLIVLMALDHASALVSHVHSNEAWDGVETYDDTSLGRLKFAARFVTVPCATGFAMLMGMGMVFLTKSRHKHMWCENRIVRRHLLRAAVILVPCMLPIESVAFSFATYVWPSLRTFKDCYIYVGVLWALGTSMAVAAGVGRALAPVPHWARALAYVVLGTGALVLTSLIVAEITPGDRINILVRLLVVPGQSSYFYVAFPTIPWAAFVLLGCAAAEIAGRSERRIALGSLAAFVLFAPSFVVLRYFGGFGNIVDRPSSTGAVESSHNGAIDFLNVIKYPPSIAFAFLSLSLVSLLAVAIFVVSRLPFPALCDPRTRVHKGQFYERVPASERESAPLTRTGLDAGQQDARLRGNSRAPYPPFSSPLWDPLLVFGRAPLFFYLGHVVLFCVVALPGDPGGLPYWAVFPIWVAGVAVLYWPSKKYGDFKRRTSVDSLWRLL